MHHTPSTHMHLHLPTLSLHVHYFIVHYHHTLLHSLFSTQHTTPHICCARSGSPHNVLHSPSVFIVLVSIFISNHNHLCSLLLLSCSARNHRFMTYWNIEHNSLKTYVRTYGRKVVQRRLYVSALWCRDKKKPPLKIWQRQLQCNCTMGKIQLKGLFSVDTTKNAPSCTFYTRASLA